MKARLLLLALACVSLAGCRARPRAPALEDSAVYSDERQGLRFLVPEGWSQQAKSDLPPGPVQREEMVVAYQCFRADPPAALQVTLVDLPEDADIEARLDGSVSMGRTWKVKGAPLEIEAGGARGKRYALAPQGKADQVREVSVFRRGGRVFFFIGTFGPADSTRRSQVRQAVASVVWLR